MPRENDIAIARKLLSVVVACAIASTLISLALLAIKIADPSPAEERTEFEKRQHGARESARTLDAIGVFDDLDVDLEEILRLIDEAEPAERGPIDAP